MQQPIPIPPYSTKQYSYQKIGGSTIITVSILYRLSTAIYDNLKAGEVVRGGSTITMQLARLMEPKARNIPNKFIEMFRAFQLEHAYSKSEILTFYFNMLPYGGNIVGTAAASRFYFNKPQHTLSLGEAALLAAIPNAPERLRPDRFPENARKAREKVLNRLLARRQISEQQWQEAVQEPIPHKRYPLPFKAPHLSRLLIKENRKKFGVRNPSHSSTRDGRIHLSRLLIKENRKKFGVRNPSHSSTRDGRIHLSRLLIKENRKKFGVRNPSPLIDQRWQDTHDHRREGSGYCGTPP